MPKKKPEKPDNLLSPKREMFCREFVIDFNATQAAIRAGYSKKTAQEQSTRLLSNVLVKARVDELRGELARQSGIDAGRVLREIARIALFNLKSAASWVGDEVILKDSDLLTEDEAAAISEVSSLKTRYGNTVKIKTHDKPKALEMLGRHLALFTDKTEISGPNGGAVRVAYDYSKLSDSELNTLLNLATRIEVRDAG